MKKWLGLVGDAMTGSLGFIIRKIIGTLIVVGVLVLIVSLLGV